jgi:hypothetical protein
VFDAGGQCVGFIRRIAFVEIVGEPRVTSLLMTHLTPFPLQNLRNASPVLCGSAQESRRPFLFADLGAVSRVLGPAVRFDFSCACSALLRRAGGVVVRAILTIEGERPIMRVCAEVPFKPKEIV